MAVVGFQLLLTILILSLMNKVSSKYSFARWVLTKGGLIRYIHPSNERLKEAISSGAGTSESSQAAPTGRKNSRRRRHQDHHHDGQQQQETFNVPRTVTLSLEAEPLSLLQLIQLPYYSDLQWLIDFSLYSLIVYFATEAYFTLFPENLAIEHNLGIVWCLLSLSFALKLLATITWTFFRGGDVAMGERSMCIVAFCIFFLLSMIVLIPNEELLEFGLVDAYKHFNSNALKLLESQGKIDQAYGPASFLIVRFCLAIICGVIGMFFIFPGLRIARMHKDALVYAEDNRALLGLYHLSFISPLLIILFWIKPISRNYLSVREWPNRGVLMTSETFETVRLVYILLVITLRLSLFRRYLQSYLNIAPQKLSYLRKEAGKITNVDLQKLIARVHYYVCVASIQFLAPLFLCLFLTFLTKSTGDYRWTGQLLFSSHNSSSLSSPTTLVTNSSQEILVNSSHHHTPTNPIFDDESFLNQTLIVEPIESVLENITANSSNATSSENFSAQATAQLTLALLRDVFSPIVLRGVIGFLLWWTASVWFSTAAIGFVYHTYFD